MAVEIEIKARLNDYVSIKDRISVFGNCGCSYEKYDTYWFPPPDTAASAALPAGVRVRRECVTDPDGVKTENILVTYKIKKISGGMEINDEHECTVSGTVVFEELLNRLGLRRGLSKEKRGWAWTIPPADSGLPPIRAEISNVRKVGWFIELEIVTDRPADSSFIEGSRKRLHTLLEKLEIPAQQIESRPYSQVLLEKQAFNRHTITGGCFMKETVYRRPSWDEYFMEVCNAISRRATCDRGRSGCVIARDNQLLVTGYVGAPAGLPHCDEAGHQFKKMLHEDGSITTHCVRTVHAEQNAICQAAKRGISIDGATLYCRMTPCRTCAMLIINCGIIRVVCQRRYHDSGDSQAMFDKAGIVLEYVYDETQQYDSQ